MSEQTFPLDLPPQNPEVSHDGPLMFPPSGDIPKPYPEGHPARRYLENLIPDNLTPEEKSALDEIAGNNGQQDLKEQLQEGYVSQIAKDLDRAMLKSLLPQTTIVFRAEGPQSTAPGDFPPGVSDPNPCYISTTLDEALALSWLNTATVSRIVVPAGTPVAIPHLDEAEILLPRESVFETHGARTGVKPNGSPVTYVDKTLIPGSKAIDEAKAFQAELDAQAKQKAETENQPGSVPIDWQNPFA